MKTKHTKINPGSGDVDIDFAVAKKPFTEEIPVLGHSWFFNFDMFYDFELHYFECSDCGLIVHQYRNTENSYGHLISNTSKCSYVNDSLFSRLPSCETVKMHEALV